MPQRRSVPPLESRHRAAQVRHIVGVTATGDRQHPLRVAERNPGVVEVTGESGVVETSMPSRGRSGTRVASEGCSTIGTGWDGMDARGWRARPAHGSARSFDRREARRGRPPRGRAPADARSACSPPRRPPPPHPVSDAPGRTRGPEGLRAIPSWSVTASTSTRPAAALTTSSGHWAPSLHESAHGDPHVRGPTRIEPATTRAPYIVSMRHQGRRCGMKYP